jgi:hypothetical protein
MSYIKFNQVFGFLLVLSALSAFVIPRPARSAGQWVHARVAQKESPDKRNAEDVKAENQLLRERNVWLEAQLEVERQRNAQWARLGSLKDRCVPVDVAGSDSGNRDSLALEGSTLGQVEDRDVALYPGGVAGQIQGKVGIAGAQLRLITDKGFKVRGHFIRTTRAADGTPHTKRLTAMVLFEGAGGALVVRPPLSEQAVKDLQPGDVAVAEERDWPTDLVGLTLGSIAKIEPKRDAPGFAELRVEPQTNLEMLDEVMVLVK